MSYPQGFRPLGFRGKPPISAPREGISAPASSLLRVFLPQETIIAPGQNRVSAPPPPPYRGRRKPRRAITHRKES